jgi:hypothetical protein
VHAPCPYPRVGPFVYCDRGSLIAETSYTTQLELDTDLWECTKPIWRFKVYQSIFHHLKHYFKDGSSNSRAARDFQALITARNLIEQAVFGDNAAILKETQLYTRVEFSFEGGFYSTAVQAVCAVGQP